MKITNKNRLHTARIVILTLLFQLLSSSVFALVSTPQENESLLTICTAQGYKQVWVNLESEKKPHFAASNCAYCLLNHIELDAIDLDLVRYLNFEDGLTDQFLTTQAPLSPIPSSKLLPIRGPPQYL